MTVSRTNMGNHRVRVLAAALILTALTSLPAAAATISVSAGGNLQAALDGAAPGDTILLEAGATFTGNFVVRSGKQGITIRSSAADALLPPAGQRTGPQYSPYLPKLRSPSSAAALTIEPGASDITIVNLEVLAAANGSSNLIELGYADGRQTSAAQAPHHLEVDRILVVVGSTVAQKRAIALNSGDTRVLGCYLAGLKYAGADAQAIAGWNGPGPFLIENNYLEGAGENLMFGGSDPSIPGLVPANIQIRRNHLSKPLSWKGSSWTVKNILELKNAQDVVIEGNLLEYNWQAAQTGYSVLFTPRNQYGGNPSTVVQRVAFINNKVRHVSAVFNILGRDTNYPSQLTNDIEIRNNVFEDVSRSSYGGTGRMLIIDGGDNIRILNNTSFNTGTAIYATGHAVTNFVLQNTILNYGDYGIMGDNASPGNGTLTMWFPGAVVLGNVMPNNTQPWTFPSGNSYPATWTNVGFVDLAAGNYRLATTSAYIVAGTGGTTPGANIDVLEAAMGSAPPPPACAFSVTPASHASPSGGDSLAVTVAASTQTCAWTAASDQGWVTLSSAAGTGSGSITLTVGANGTTSGRTATVNVGGVPVGITQAAAPPPVCTFSVSPATHASPSGGDAFTISVTASDQSCAWASSSDQAWATVSNSGGTGSGTVTVTVAPNGTTAERSATIAVAGVDVIVTEAAPPPPIACTFTLSPTSVTVPAAGATVAATLTASGASCGWTARANASWLSLSASTGTGTATLSVAVAATTSNGTRNGSVTIGGLTLNVQQYGRRRK